jgi:hypothetical protein
MLVSASIAAVACEVPGSPPVMVVSDPDAIREVRQEGLAAFVLFSASTAAVACKVSGRAISSCDGGVRPGCYQRGEPGGEGGVSCYGAFQRKHCSSCMSSAWQPEVGLTFEKTEHKNQSPGCRQGRSSSTSSSCCSYLVCHLHRL